MEQLTVKNYNPAMSEDTTVLLTALLEAKKNFTATGLNGLNKHTNNKYPLLKDIYKAVEPALFENGILISHFNRPADTGMEFMHSRLTHATTGQFIEDCRIVESEKPGNQGKGAANTYMKKYAILTLCAIAPEEDDDGEEEQKYIEKKKADPLLSSEQVSVLKSLIDSAKNGVELYESIKKVYKVEAVSDIKASSFETIKSYIVKNRE